MTNRRKLINFAICTVLILAMNEIGIAQQAAQEAPVMAAQSGYVRTTPLVFGSEEWHRRVEEINRKYDEEQRRRQKAAEESYARSIIDRQQQKEWDREEKRRRLMSEGEIVRCWAKGGKNYECRGGLKCCYFFRCCNGFQEFLSYWPIWWLPLVVIIGACVVCLRHKKPTTITTVPTAVEAATTTCMNNTCTTSNAGIATTVHSTSTYNGNGYEVHVEDPSTFLLSSTSRSRHQSGESNHRSRHQSGRNTPSNSAYQSGCNTPTSAYQDIPTGGTGSGAPPSYFDAVYKGVGQRTGTPTMNEHQSSDTYHDASAPVE